MSFLTDNDKKKILDLKEKYSIYATWSDAELFQKIVNSLSNSFESLNVDKVVGLEARGFILGAAVAYKLHAGFVVIRKEGLMYKDGYKPEDVLQEECIHYSGKRKVLELEKHEEAIQKGDRVIIVDDWFEKGGQGHAAIKLVHRAGGIVVGVGVLLDEMTDEVRDSFSKYNLHTLVTFES